MLWSKRSAKLFCDALSIFLRYLLRPSADLLVTFARNSCDRLPTTLQGFAKRCVAFRCTPDRFNGYAVIPPTPWGAPVGERAESFPKKLPRGSSEGPRRSPRGSREDPGGPQEAPGGTQEAPKRPQEAPRRLQEAPEGSPRGPQEVPKRSQEAPRGSQEALRGSQEASRDS